MEKARLIALAITLAASGSGNAQLPARDGFMQPDAWEIGPITGGRSSSRGVPARPFETRDGLAFNIPRNGSANYVTTNAGSLAGRSRITLRYRVEGGELKARQPSPESDAATLTLYFQRCGDDWLAQSGTETFRWWAGFATVRPLVAGEGVVTADLTDPRWSSVMGETKANRRAEFQAALANTCRVGFTLGGGYNFGHGIYSTGPARFTILDFKVEGRRRR